MNKKIFTFASLITLLLGCVSCKTKSSIEMTEDVFSDYDLIKDVNINYTEPFSLSYSNKSDSLYDLPFTYYLPIKSDYHENRYTPSMDNGMSHFFYGFIIYSNCFLTANNIYEKDDITLIFDGKYLYYSTQYHSGVSNYQITILNQTEKDILSSAIIKTDEGFTLYSVDEECKGRRYLLDDEYKLIEVKDINVINHPQKKDLIKVAHTAKFLTTSNDTDFYMNNMRFKFDTATNTLTTDGYTFFTKQAAIKKENNSYHYEKNHTFGESGDGTDFSMKDYTNSTLIAYVDNKSVVNLFFQIEYDENGECFLEYMRITNSKFEHYYFYNSAYLVSLPDENSSKFFFYYGKKVSNQNILAKRFHMSDE